LWIGLLREIPSDSVGATKNQTLKYLTVSGASLALEAIERIRSHFQGATVIKTYGQSETFRSLISKTLPGEKMSDSLGFPLSGVTLELVDDMGSSVRGAGHGQLLHIGHGTMMGYLNNPNALNQPDARASQGNTQNSGILTGDYFDRDEVGQYFFRGRRDDLVKRWEHRLFLSETEQAIRELPEIEQAIVLHRPVKDARQNEMVAFVILRPGFSEDFSEAVLQHCKTCLAPHKVPDDILILPMMPQTESLKVDRKQLLSYWEKSVVKPRNLKHRSRPRCQKRRSLLSLRLKVYTGPCCIAKRSPGGKCESLLVPKGQLPSRDFKGNKVGEFESGCRVRR
jgi:acyl-coenzyme A synthetase/AMP-(fatty) acid ligase